jgi:hypothetical protein
VLAQPARPADRNVLFTNSADSPVTVSIPLSSLHLARVWPRAIRSVAETIRTQLTVTT